MMLDRVWPTRVEVSAQADTVVEFRWREPVAERELNPTGSDLSARR
jgi:hypothetical protein